MTTGRIRDGNGKPIAAVVSDGLTAQLTGDDGHFDLPGWGSFVWVCPPEGWACRRWWRRADDPTQDFVLHPLPPDTNSRIAHVTDLHLTSGNRAECPSVSDSSVLDPIADAVRSRRAGLVVVTGDVTDRGTSVELRTATKALSVIGVPFRLLPGNHDHYGHLDDPSPADLPVHDNELGSATFTRWEEIVGPRWWSMNFAGLHLVAFDWFSARTGHDREVQLSWMAADLSLIAAGQPVVLLAHEQPDATTLQSLKRHAPFLRLVAVLSGHRHAPRAVRLNHTLHLYTGPAIVAGRDCSRPQMRLVEWDGKTLLNRTVPLDRALPPRVRALPPNWSFQTRLTPSRTALQLAAHPEGVIATTADHDEATGGVTLLDQRTGKVVWSWPSPQPLASSAAVSPDGSLFLQTVGGLTVRLDDGQPTWMIDTPDPAATWVTSPPVLAPGGDVITEGPGFVRSLRGTDGRVRWITEIQNAGLSHVHPDGRLCDGLAVLPLTGWTQGLTVLNPDDGAVVWPDRIGTPNPRSSPLPLGDGTAIIVRDGALVERFELATGRTVWRTGLGSLPSAATPALLDELALIVTADGVIHILDSRTGWLLRRHHLPTVAEHSAPMGTPRVARAVVAAADFLHLITVTGEWWRLDPFHWEPVLVASLPMPVTEQPVQIGDNLYVPGREGIVLAASPLTHTLHKDGAAHHAEARSSPRSDRWLRSLRLLKS